MQNDGKQDGIYSLNVDVYNFGAVVFELATGKDFDSEKSDIRTMKMDYTLELENFIAISTESDQSKRCSIFDLA